MRQVTQSNSAAHEEHSVRTTSSVTDEKKPAEAGFSLEAVAEAHRCEIAVISCIKISTVGNVVTNADFVFA